MFCVNCGQEIADGAAFCPKCGAKQVPAPEVTYTAPEQPVFEQPAPQQDYNSYGTSAPAPDGKKKTPLGLILGIIAAVVVIAVLIIVLVAGKSGKKDAAPVEEPAAEESAETPAEEAAPEAEAASEETVEDTVEVPAGLGGHYILTEITEDGETYGTDLIALFGGESYLDLNDDGTFYLYFIAEDSSAEGTWADNTLTSGDEDVAFDYDPEAMTVSISDEESGLVMTFTHESVAPEIEYADVDLSSDGTNEDSTDADTYFLYNFEIPETVVYDKDGVTVTLTGVEDDGWYGYDVNFTVANSTDTNILITAPVVAINGCMIDTGIWTDVAAGKNANDSFSISYTDLESAGLTQFFDLALQIEVEDYDTWDDIGTSDLIHIYVDEDAENGYEADALPEGELIFDSNGIQLYFIGLEDDGWGDGDGYAYFMIVNNSGHDLYAYADDVSYNGWMVSDSFGSSIPDGFWTVDTMLVDGYEDAKLESYEDITEIEFSFHCVDDNNWDKLSDETTITLSIG